MRDRCQRRGGLRADGGFAADRWGRIDILVNNGAVRVDKTAEEHTAADLDWIMGINVRGLFHACQAVYPFMRRQHKGRIINIASISARKGRSAAPRTARRKAPSWP